MNTIHIEHVSGHIEVYNGNEFLFSADTEQEAEHELRDRLNSRKED